MTDNTSEKTNTITILGSGTSTGIPMIGCSCSVCTSLDHRDKRLRTSIFVTTKKGKKFIVDTGPDLRTQVLRENISAIDFAIITHEHADHLHGIDDLRPFSFTIPPRAVPVYTKGPTALAIKNRFSYIFPREDRIILGGGIPKINLQEIIFDREVMIEDEMFYFFKYSHGHSETLGFIHDGFAYIVDCHEITPAMLKVLREKNLEFLLIDCLQKKDQGTHLFVERSFEYIKEINPKRAGLIHIGHDLGHRELSSIAEAEFGEKVFTVYDGLKIHY